MEAQIKGVKLQKKTAHTWVYQTALKSSLGVTDVVTTCLNPSESQKPDSKVSKRWLTHPLFKVRLYGTL